ncbi:MAG: NUDIX hydrolase [Proteobacteria bacterium]|nr:NUDIX hydrolase [Pseudomonadota bacterium]
MNDKTQAPEPKPAATILLLRDGTANLEVFMVVRHHQIDFASGALVFPGGKADPQDFAEALIPHLRGQEDDSDMRAAQVSAIREAFEECGILLARELGSDNIISGERLASLQEFREPMNKGDISLLDFLQQQKLQLACDQLTHFAHWITPPMMPKRFDTHFYLVTAPDDHIALHDGYESVDSVWIEPQAAVNEANSGKRTIIFPTLRNLGKLAAATNVSEAMNNANNSTMVPVLPWTEKRDDGNYLCIPKEAGYAISEEKMPERSA